MSTLTLHAHAKLNLFLHILGRRADGYHSMESLVVFTDLADVLTLTSDDTLTLQVDGEFANPAGAGYDNLVLKAAQLVKKHTGYRGGARLQLTKNIPVGAGLGGGSADAAAALTGLNQLWQLELNAQELYRLGGQLGADVPMCLAAVPLLARDIGDVLTPLAAPLPALHAVLVHPRIPLLTSQVYAAFSGLTPENPWHDSSSDADFWQQLMCTQNHLQPAAMAVNQLVAEVLRALETVIPKPALVRMSGSGACCYALYRTQEEAADAAAALATSYPQWWVRRAAILS